MDITFHCNTSLPHQREHGEWLHAGFKRHGLNLNVTPDINADGDIHIISGPHYALNRWSGHPNTIFIDRAYIPEHQMLGGHWKSETWISIGWMRIDGGREFKITSGRVPPITRDNASDRGTIFLRDYGGPDARADAVRFHPAERRPDIGLIDELRRYRTAIGYNTSALVAAGLEGLEIDCRDNRNIMAEQNWLELLPYADWHFKEIESGELIEHLWQQRFQ